MDDNNEENMLDKFLDLGPDLAAGISVVLLTNIDPSGYLGALVDPPLRRTFEWASSTVQRALGRQQSKRVGACAQYALDRINKLRKEGRQFRQDGFFDPEHEPSTATEILEGCFLAARDSYQEKKLPFIGKLFANIAFSDYPKETCHHFVSLVNRLTYRQLCLMRLAMILPRHLRNQNYDGITFRASEASLLRELLELHQLGLVQFYNQAQNEFLFPVVIRQIIPAFLGPDLEFGFHFIGMIGLDEMNDTELQEIQRALAAPKKM